MGSLFDRAKAGSEEKYSQILAVDKQNFKEELARKAYENKNKLTSTEYLKVVSVMVYTLNHFPPQLIGWKCGFNVLCIDNLSW